LSGLEGNPLVLIIVAVIAGIFTTIGIILKKPSKKDKDIITHDQFRIELDEIKERVAWIEGNLGKQ